MPTFDQQYYDRFYRDPATRAADAEDNERQARFIHAFLEFVDVPIGSILDVGCGLGGLLRALTKHYPNAPYQGVEASEYICESEGWELGTLPGYQPERTFDLVICHDVLAYLDDADAHRAIDEIAGYTERALFFAAMTTDDWTMCDTDRTDPDVVTRSVDWYRNALREHFDALGGGLWLKRPHDALLWHLDRF